MAHYDDPRFSYLSYWNNRKYEHGAEILALKKLLGTNKYTTIADIGGGYGRLTSFLAGFGDEVYLIEPSLKQREIAKKQLRNLKNIHIEAGESDETKFKPDKLDLAVVVRVSHHLPNLEPTFKELDRIIKPGGFLIFELANSTNIKSWLKNRFSGTPVPQTPVEKRSPVNIRKNTIPFVNHHPKTCLKLLQSNNFIVKKTLSVSNFRSPVIKKIFPLMLLLVLESVSQTLFSSINFGPSIFILAQKKNP